MEIKLRRRKNPQTIYTIWGRSEIDDYYEQHHPRIWFFGAFSEEKEAYRVCDLLNQEVQRILGICPIDVFGDIAWVENYPLHKNKYDPEMELFSDQTNYYVERMSVDTINIPEEDESQAVLDSFSEVITHAIQSYSDVITDALRDYARLMNNGHVRGSIRILCLRSIDHELKAHIDQVWRAAGYPEAQTEVIALPSGLSSVVIRAGSQ